MSILYFRRIGLPEVHAWSTNVIWSGRASHSFSRYHSRKTIDNICVIVHRHNTHHTRRMTATWSVCRQWSKCGGGVPVNTIFRQRIIVQNRAVRHQSCRHLATGETWTSKRRFTPTIGGRHSKNNNNTRPIQHRLYATDTKTNRIGTVQGKRGVDVLIRHPWCTVTNTRTPAIYTYTGKRTNTSRGRVRKIRIGTRVRLKKLPAPSTSY